MSTPPERGGSEPPVAGPTEETEARGPGRRRFLRGAGGAGTAFLLAACSGEKDLSSRWPVDEASVVAHRVAYPGDLRTVALSAALENQVVGVYASALAAAGAGRLGTVPPALTSFLNQAMAQHTDHAKAWNAVLTRAGKPALTGVPLSDQQEITATLAKATSAADAAALALQLEEQAAQTYLLATYSVGGTSEIERAATIAPVEAMHASTLRFLLGQYPVPDGFLPVDRAARPSLLTI